LYLWAVGELPIVAKLLSAQVCPTRVLHPLLVPLQPVIAASMGKHFSPIELDNIHQWKSESCQLCANLDDN